MKLKKNCFKIILGLVAILLLKNSRVYGENLTSKTLKDFIETGFEPVGQTMYVWGGGWNEADTGAGIEALSFGLSPVWQEYFLGQEKNYNYKNTRYEIHKGLDCSGYIGWLMYNSLPNEKGYVMKASKMSREFANMGLGSFMEKGRFKDYVPGDILSSRTHVYLSLGKCKDGSVLLLHASPPGVILSGTGENSQAARLAKKYMKKYYRDWDEKFPNYTRDLSYLRDYDRFRWDENILKDPDGYRLMTPEEILKDIFSEEPRAKILFKHKYINFDSKLIVREDRNYYPFREAVEKIGGQVVWQEASQNVLAYYGENSLEFRIGQDYYWVNGDLRKMDARPFISGDKTYVPIRYVYEGLGLEVDWDEGSNTIRVN